MPTDLKKILIIEDESALAQALELMLTHAGFEAMVARNGKEGISFLQKETYSLILLDIIMPKMDGFQVLEKINDMKVETPIIILTNLSREGDEKRARELGAKEFLVKSNTPVTTIVEQVALFLK